MAEHAGAVNNATLAIQMTATDLAYMISEAASHQAQKPRAMLANVSTDVAGVIAKPVQNPVTGFSPLTRVSLPGAIS